MNIYINTDKYDNIASLTLNPYVKCLKEEKDFHNVGCTETITRYFSLKKRQFINLQHGVKFKHIAKKLINGKEVDPFEIKINFKTKKITLC